jgi:hypothetical protein
MLRASVHVKSLAAEVMDEGTRPAIAYGAGGGQTPRYRQLAATGRPERPFVF